MTSQQQELLTQTDDQQMPQTTENEQNEQNVDAIPVVTPDVINLDYQYVRLLGEGANGRTWLAKDRKTALNVAIKELKLADDIKAFELFEREAEILESVDIQGVPKFFRRYNENGTSYIVQEYIPYPSLEIPLEQGKLFSEAEVFVILDLVSEILFALQTQYVPPIIHRDIKPANIIYRPKQGANEAQLWLIDFGAVANPQKQSAGSTIAGTFGYMAPEQLQGEVSIRTDFYSLGATAIHLLTGVFPYEIPSDLFKLKFRPVIAEKAPQTSNAMLNLLDFLLEQNPEKRPTDVKALRKAIREAKELSVKYLAINTDYDDDYDELDEPLDDGYLLDVELPDYKDKKGFARFKCRMHRFAFKLTRPLRRALHIAARAIVRTHIRIKRAFGRLFAKITRPIRIKLLERRERKAKALAEELEAQRQKEREKNGVMLPCTARRVTVSHLIGDDENILEGLLTHDGNWFASFIRHDDARVTIKCTVDAPEDASVKPNIFQVMFVPQWNEVTIAPKQTIWLTPDLYTPLTGKLPEAYQKKS